jgi:glycosyltransferase involved in cell wall biosynthesis
MHITHLNFAKGFRGGERQTQLLIEQLAQLGLQQKLLLRKGSQLTQRCRAIANLEIIEISKPYILHLKHIKNTTLLHAHETKAAQFAYFAHRLKGIPYIITRRVDNAIKNNFLNKKIYSNAAVVVALSRAIKDEILKVAPNAAVEVIPSAFTDAAVDKKEAVKIKNRFEGKYLIGNVGALDDGHKGQSHLIKVAKELEKSHPNIHFIFVGSGQDEAKLKAQAQGLTNITFEGFVNNVNDYISSLDLFVFPSNNEGLGSILLDVMQLNVPIIASNVGGIPDIITDNTNGLLTPPADSVQLKQNILDLYHNKEKSTKLATAAKATIERFSPSSMRDAYLSLYQKIDCSL